MKKDQLALTRKELLLVKKSLSDRYPASITVPSLSSRRFRYVCISDTHCGQKCFDYALWKKLVLFVKKEKPDFILHAGDHLEGMSGRPGHVYELTHIGFGAQFTAYLTLLKELPDGIPIYGIDGNHDQWFKIKSDCGVVVGDRLQECLPNYKHLGEWEGRLKVKNINIMLLHAADGTAHASSWKLEKRIDSFDSDNKPHILHSGHYHKALYVFRRNVHGFESGTICRQTSFMRGKNLHAHVGFWGVDVFYNKLGVDRVVSTFVPGY